jgi:SNF2 family DNA or RNA helicase
MDKITLTNYQEELKKKLSGQHGVLVNWGLGSGKSIGAIAAADQFGETRVVTPASLRGNFKKEIKSFKPTNRFSVESYEHLVNHPDVSDKVMILDEGHRLRTSGSRRSQTAQALTNKARKVLLLTGTPIQNKPHEIAPLVNIAAGHQVLPTDEKVFNYHYTRHDVDNPGIIRRMFGAKQKDVVHAINLKDFSKRVSPYISYHGNENDPSM